MSRALANARPSLTEDQMQSVITDLVEWRGGVWAHVRQSQGMHVEGLTDLIIAVPALPGSSLRDEQAAGAIVAMLELKRRTGTIRASQRPWIELITRPRIEFIGGVVRPEESADAYSLDDVLCMLGGKIR